MSSTNPQPIRRIDATLFLPPDELPVLRYHVHTNPDGSDPPKTIDLPHGYALGLSYGLLDPLQPVGDPIAERRAKILAEATELATAAACAADDLHTWDNRDADRLVELLEELERVIA